MRVDKRGSRNPHSSTVQVRFIQSLSFGDATLLRHITLRGSINWSKSANVLERVLFTNWQHGQHGRGDT